MKKKQPPTSDRPRRKGPASKVEKAGIAPSRTPRGGAPAWQAADQAFEAEQQRYEDPIPSRQLILEVLGAADGPMTVDELIGHFGLGKLSQQDALGKRLGAMTRDAQVAQNRRGAFGPVTSMHLIPGTVQAHRDGFGFLVPDAGGGDLFLPPRQMRELMNGDRVLVRPGVQDERGRTEGIVVEVLERASRSIVGRLHVDQGIAYVIPDHPRIQHDLLIPEDALAGAEHGQMVMADIIEPPGRRTLPVGRVTEILGDHLAPGMEIAVAVRAHNLPHQWPEAVEREVAAIPDTVRPQDCEGRVDLRDLPLATIDGADARDFDDAVYARKTPTGWRLWVAIADVSAYVVPGTALDREAFERGNSVYFPRQVIPMLPEKLSNGLCSLNPQVDRLCMVCEMRVLADGEVAQSRFYRAVMRSHARLIYDDVAAALAQPDGAAAQAMGPLMEPLQTLSGMFDALFSARQRRGAIDFDSTETKIVFSEARKIEAIVPVTRNRAHRMIEECMIAANVEAGRYIEKTKLPTLYRIHQKPDPLKVQTLRDLLAVRGLKLGGGAEPEASDYAAMLASAQGREDTQVLQTLMLRSLMQARYEPGNAGHFGLALTHYAHFTSPIRRYPDLLLHRGIAHAIERRKVADFAYSEQEMTAAGAHCSMTERRADEATRDVATWLKCEFMRHRVGEEFDGTVTSVASFGLFVELDGLYIDGLVHVSNLRNDYYEFDPARQRLVGSRSKQTYALGQPVRIKVVRVNLDERKIDLELLPMAGGSSDVKLDKEQSRPSPRGNKRKRK
ncbi:ribonuclease R [Flagellatimonas centrodinii]|uniref:ribonuclease R n=1 Tax=Flagellatimonas centrodinii TaxID=2806210 RepID=UPI001FED73B1|nr:ribonuclease R [Flagellatimonas centrodinii]ULQ45756.1 ribonuclease R [Flagellatimonas centrodinii]